MSEFSFTPEDMTFLRGILTDPEDLTRWLVYADWLDDRDQPLRAQYLRLSVELGQFSEGHPMRDVLGRRIAELKGQLDPDWVMMFDTPRIGGCYNRWQYQCPLTWDSLYATDTPDIRICLRCRQPVFYCHTLEEADQFASAGLCVAISSRVFPQDSTPFERFETVEIGILRYEEDDDLRYEDEYEPLDLPTAPEIEPPRQPWWKFW